MRKVIALAVVLGVAFSLPLLAAETPKPAKPVAAKGVVVAWEEGKSLKIKEHSGKEMEFALTEKTKVVGQPAVGETVVVHFTTAEGKHVASHVTVEAKAPPKESPPK